MTTKEKFIESCLFATHTAETHEEERELFGEVYDKFNKIWLDKACAWLKEHTHDQEQGWDEWGKSFIVLPTMDAYQAQFIKNFRKAMEE